VRDVSASEINPEGAAGQQETEVTSKMAGAAGIDLCRVHGGSVATGIPG